MKGVTYRIIPKTVQQLSHLSIAHLWVHQHPLLRAPLCSWYHIQPKFLVSADMSVEPVGDLGSLHDGDGSYMGYEGVLKCLTLVFEPLGRYEFA